MAQDDALVVVDLQNDFCAEAGALARMGKDIAPLAAMLPVAESLMAASRTGSSFRVLTQQTNVERSHENAHWIRLLETVVGSYDFVVEGSWGWQLSVAHQSSAREIILTKHRSDAFTRTRLEEILRSQGVSRLFLCGVVTEGCVLSTLLAATCLDFEVVIIDDAVASTNIDAHRAALRIASGRVRSVKAAEAAKELSRP